jgi:peptidoglycan-N-acetylglucosamine deacetylase
MTRPSAAPLVNSCHDAIPVRRPAHLASTGMVNALTVDFEDWYHVCGAPESNCPAKWATYESRIVRSADTVLALLRKWGVRATFFVLGYIAEREPALIRAIHREGHEIATHGHFHRRVFELSPEQFAEDLSQSLDAITAACGETAIGYRAPEWSIRPHTFWAFSVLRQYGILYDSSMVPLTRMGDRSYPSLPSTFKTPHGDIVEFPLTTVRLLWERIPFTGGLPLRLTPYFFILDTIRQLNQSGWPALIYLHPWEFDPAQPRIDLPWTRRFMHYFNLPATARKCEGLLRHLRLAPIREVLAI